MNDLSIVVVTWNTRDLVIECLVSIDRALEWGSKLAVEILVVDNGSTDGTCEAVRECFPDARLIARPRNGGFAAGANHGIREATGRHILLLNSDAKLEPGTLEACVGYLDDHPDVGIVGPQLVNPDGSRQNSIHNFPMLATASCDASEHSARTTSSSSKRPTGVGACAKPAGGWSCFPASR